MKSKMKTLIFQHFSKSTHFCKFLQNIMQIFAKILRIISEFFTKFSAFLFPHSLLFCVHGMLPHQLVHPLALARREERMTYSCLQKNRGRRLVGRLHAPLLRGVSLR